MTTICTHIMTCCASGTCLSAHEILCSCYNPPPPPHHHHHTPHPTETSVSKGWFSLVKAEAEAEENLTHSWKPLNISRSRSRSRRRRRRRKSFHVSFWFLRVHFCTTKLALSISITATLHSRDWHLIVWRDTSGKKKDHWTIKQNKGENLLRY